MPKKITREEFFKRTKEVHSDNYDYSLVDYIDTNIEISIICPIHGEFKQTPHNHLKSKGCLKCSNRYQPTTEDVKLRAIKIHGDKYDYSKFIYNGTHTKSIIICSKHGEFMQTPNTHINTSNGCLKCSFSKKHTNIKKTTKEFIEQAIHKHGNKYDYSLAEYVNANTKVKIICPLHGEFEQKSNLHLAGGNCNKCVGGVKSNTEEFIKKAKDKHGNKYDYSKVNYINNHTKLTIICPIHGIFPQPVYTHLAGHKCPVCTNNDRLTVEKFIKKILI